MRAESAIARAAAMSMDEEAKIVCKDLLAYLQDLPTAILINLYGYSAACLAVFR